MTQIFKLEALRHLRTMNGVKITGIIFIIGIILATMGQGTSVDGTVKVSEYKTWPIYDVKMQCIQPAEAVQSPNRASETCRMNATKTLEMGQTTAILQHEDNPGSTMKCFNGTKLHRGVLNWERTMLLDICSIPLRILPGYYPILSKRSDKLTFYEGTECRGNQKCPVQPYYSDKIVSQYNKLANGTYAWKSFSFIVESTESPTSSTGRLETPQGTINFPMVLVIVMTAFVAICH